MAVVTEGEIFKEVTSRVDDEFIQYQFEAEKGDSFDIELSLGEAHLTERFEL